LAPPPAIPTASPLSRRERLREATAAAPPFSSFLTDTFGRQHDYLRISVTERCNLRCTYCMPAEGVQLSPARSLLTTPEIVLLARVFVAQGVRKIRLTGGEPTVRRDIVPLMRRLGELRDGGLRELCITTNGLTLHRKLDDMVEAGLTAVNLSLDTLDPHLFEVMTRRRGLDAVLRSLDRAVEMQTRGMPLKLKVNVVVMRGVNDGEMEKFVALTRERDMEVRFIEYMPFDGNRWNRKKMLPYAEMLERIRAAHPGLERVTADSPSVPLAEGDEERGETSKTFRVPGYRGRVGFITSMTHNFCGTCNRLRVTGDGNLKVCLFGNDEVSLRDIVRTWNGGEPIDEAAYETLVQGLVGGQTPAGASPHHLPLLASAERRLLEVIGTAVKGKKEKHAGLGELEHMKNRPMILIGG
jgi:GTP 3',8-cyclase